MFPGSPQEEKGSQARALAQEDVVLAPITEHCGAPTGAPNELNPTFLVALPALC